jgi:Xaa-Pro aminopeptidase
LFFPTNIFLFSSSDSGAQYYDGTCDTTRTVHFGRPTPDMSEAYTRVLQGHVSFFISFLFIYSLSNHSSSLLLFNLARNLQIAIDSAIFPEGTSGRQLDVLARKALWKDGMNYMVRRFTKMKPKTQTLLLQLPNFIFLT